MGGRRCCVPNCRRTQYEGSIFAFPLDEGQCREWCHILGITFSPVFMKKRHMGVCHLHFDKKDYRSSIRRELVGEEGGRKVVPIHGVVVPPLEEEEEVEDKENINGAEIASPSPGTQTQGGGAEGSLQLVSFPPIVIPKLKQKGGEEMGSATSACGLCREEVAILFSPPSKDLEGRELDWISDLELDCEEALFCSKCAGVIAYVFTLQMHVRKVQDEVGSKLEVIKAWRKEGISKGQDNFDTTTIKSEDENGDALSDASFVLYPDSEIELTQPQMEEEKFHVDQYSSNEVLEDDLNHDDLVLPPEDESSGFLLANDDVEEQKLSYKKRMAANAKTSLRKAKRRKTVFHCGSCEESFPLRIKYVRHLKETQHNPGTSVEVIKPNNAYGSSRRIVPSVPGPPFICPGSSCSRSFKTVKNYRRHYCGCHSQEHCKFGCDVCNMKFWNKFGFNAHIDTLGHRIAVMKKEGLKELPPRKNKFICKHCGKELFSVGAYYYHLETHNDSSDELCEHCGKCFRSLIRLKQHLAKCASKKIGKECKPPMEATPLEPNSEPDPNSLCNPSPSTSSSFACEDCGRVFGKQKFLNIHIRDVHILKTRLPPPVVNNDPLNNLCCRYCGKMFNFVGNRRKHERNVHIPMEEKLRCQHCGETFETVDAKVLHIRSVHAGRRSVACPQCDKLFPTYGYMKLHQRQVHISHAVPCPKCGKKFKTKSSMTIHVRTTCEPDPKCKWVSHLRDYSKRKYKELRETKPHKCDKCREGFPEARMLRKHKERCAESEEINGDC